MVRDTKPALSQVFVRRADGDGPRRVRPEEFHDGAIECAQVFTNPAERVAIPDDDELPRPPARVLGAVPERSLGDHLISLALRVAALAFLVTVLICLGESL